MSCYHPLVGLPSGEKTVNGKDKLIIRKSEWSTDIERELQNEGAVLIPCGHCIGCRLDYSRRWADRMMLELATSEKAVFVTLTYDNDHIHWSQFDDYGLPMYGTLDKRDCQLFFKRLRKYCDEHLNGRKIRFYLAGEYGSKTLRPHYHAIIYGIGLCDFNDLRLCGRNELKQNYYTSEIFEKIWDNGFILLADVSWKSCAYVARYVTKKMNGDKALCYAERNVISEFSLMSRKPGIGAEYLQHNPDCLDYQSINIPTPEGGLKIFLPRYYLKQLELIDPERYDILKAERKKYASDRMMIELSKTDLGMAEYLESKEMLKLDKIKALKRR